VLAIGDSTPEIDSTHWAAHLEARRLLSVVLCQPERDAFIEENVGRRLVSALEELVPGCADEVQALDAALDREDQETLLSEYARIFIGPNRLPAPPYGSVYLGPGRQVGGEATEEVARLYREEGLEVAEPVHEPPDHAALELEFAGFLLGRAARVWMDGSQDEAEYLLAKARSFEDDHLRSWLPQLAASIGGAAQTDFYRGVARSLEVYCRSEMPLLPDRPSAETSPGAESWRSRDATG
jgi:TorA maturation chaperone TorD